MANNLASRGDPFWWLDPVVLVRMDRWFEFYPAESMNPAEKLNSMMRFGIYGSILLYVYTLEVRSAYLLLGISLLTCLLYFGHKEAFTSLSSIGVQNAPIAARLEDVIDPLAQRGAHLGFISTLETPDSSDKPFQQRPGLVNSFGTEDKVPPALVRRPDGAVCVAPTRNNPYMNVLMSDYTDAPDRPGACNVQDADVLKTVEEKGQFNLYRDVNDLFGNMTNQRNFYTMPSTTIPNDRDTFAKFCFNDINKGCKSGHVENCVRNIDLRQQRGTVDEVIPLFSASPAASSYASVGSK